MCKLNRKKVLKKLLKITVKTRVRVGVIFSGFLSGCAPRFVSSKVREEKVNLKSEGGWVNLELAFLGVYTNV